MTQAMSTSTVQMADTGSKAHDVASQLRGMLTRLMGELEPLQGAWKGAAAGSFESVRARYEQDVNKLNTALESLAATLGKANVTYSTTDSDLESNMSSTGAQAGSITSALQVL